VVIEANIYRHLPIWHPSPPECGFDPIFLLPRWGSVSGRARPGLQPGEKVTDLGDPSMTSNSTSCALTYLWRRRLHLIGLRAISANSTAGPLPVSTGAERSYTEIGGGDAR
jgi:hypothetical protein